MSNDMWDVDEFYEIADVEVQLYENGSRIGDTFQDVFDRFYDPVEERINSTAYHQERGRMPNSKMGQVGDNALEAMADQDRKAWLDDLEDVEAKMYLEIGEKKPQKYELNLAPRTDFGFEDVQFTPSVVKVMNGDAMWMAVRQWADYDNDTADEEHEEMLSKLQSYGKYFKHNSHDDDFYRHIGTPEYNPDSFSDGITMIPELYLESALHKEDGVYEEDAVMPVTPYNIKVAELHDDTAYVLRPWLHNEFDGGLSHSVEAKRLGTFYGTCEALNLVGCFDREDEFYRDPVSDADATVFIDPEFWAYTNRDRWFIGSDWDDFTDQLAEYGDVTESFIDKVKDRKNVIKDYVQSETDVDVLDELPRQVDRDLFPRKKLVETRV